MSPVPDATHLSRRNRAGEQGSALLIVFVFAAVIAIMLYREMPVAVFEARRNKEQQLEDRGKEYVRAVQLFYRKNQRYPPSIEALENTNRVRYLRQRYKDPFTGKDDWRLLHAGPGGMLLDSKVKKPLTPALTANGTNGQTNGTPGQNSNGFGSSSNTSFGNNTNAPNAANANNNNNPNADSTDPAADNGTTFGPSGAFADSSEGLVIPSAIRRRAPAMSASGASGHSVPSSAALDANPSTPLVPSGDGSFGTGFSGLGSADPLNGDGQQAGAANPSGSNPSTSNMKAVGSLLQTSSLPNSGNSSSFSTSTSGQLNSGGLAGIASKAKGRTIKKVNDQKDYSLWEFYYDPSQDTSTQAGNARGAAGANSITPGQNIPGANGFGTTNNSGFGKSGNSSGFGSSGFGNNGQSNSNSNQQQPNGMPGQNGTDPNAVQNPNGGNPADPNAVQQDPSQQQNQSQQNGNQPQQNVPQNNPPQ
jgi:hypothetical protein